MGLTTTLVNYKSIKVADKELLLDGSAIVSFNPPTNKIEITMQPLEYSLSYFEVRITKATDPYDINVGIRPAGCYSYNVSANKEHTFIIDVNEENFIHGNGEYRISLYAKSALDGKWDIVYLFFTSGGLQFTLADGTPLAVSTKREAPLETN